MVKKFLLTGLMCAGVAHTLPFGQSALAQSADDSKRESLSVTIYNNNLGVVREVRQFDVKGGTSEIKLTDVPAQIDPTTVKISSHNHPNDVEVIEQNYEYDLVSQTKLLEKYIDKTISVIDDKGTRIEGTLLAIEGDKLTLSTGNGITMLPNLTRYSINVPTLPQGLITRPTLVWQLNAGKSYSNEPLDIVYQTGGMNWHAEYIAALSEDDKSLDLNGWVSLENTSGASFNDAKLKLVAGAINRVQAPRPPIGRMDGDYAYKSAAPQFEERGFFEYHIYDLQRKTSIANNEVKQVSLLEAAGVAATKKYTYRGGKNAEVSVEFENTDKNKLGIPLPMGTVRVMKKDKDGSMEFVGEDRIEHTPLDEKITLKVGDAFDIVGERVVTDQRTMGSNSSQQTIEITLKNRKDEPVTIDAIENLGGNWEILKSSMDYEKKNAYEVIFHVPVKARSEQKVTYTVFYRW